MKIIFWIVTGLLVLLLLAAAYFGLTEGFVLLHRMHGPLEVLAVVTELLYGLFAVAGLVGVVTRHRATPIVLVLWALALTAGASLSPVVWGRAPVAVGIRSAIVVGLASGLLVVGWWYAWRRLRHGAPPGAA